jgi:hypothetical protein
MEYGTLSHPPYFSDLSTADYKFFKHLDLKEKAFGG